MQAFFDYFAFTLQVTSNDFERPLAIIQGLISCALESPGRDGSGMYFYSNTARWDGALVAWGGEHQKDTILVSITGSGCRHFRAEDLIHLVRSVSEYGQVRPKRFDLAVDVPGFDAFFTIHNNYSRLLISSRVETSNVMLNRNLKSGKTDGGTLYFGSRTSPRMTRVYTKIRQDNAQVTRIEIEAKEGWAVRVLELFLAGRSESVIMLSLCRDYLALDLFVSTAGVVPVEVTYPKRERVRAMAVWLLQNVAGCIEDVRKAYGDHFITDLAMAGWFKRKKHRDTGSPAPYAGRTPGSNTGVQVNFLENINGVLEAIEEERISG